MTGSHESAGMLVVRGPGSASRDSAVKLVSTGGHALSPERMSREGHQPTFTAARCSSGRKKRCRYTASEAASEHGAALTGSVANSGARRRAGRRAAADVRAETTVKCTRKPSAETFPAEASSVIVSLKTPGVNKLYPFTAAFAKDASPTEFKCIADISPGGRRIVMRCAAPQTMAGRADCAQWSGLITTAGDVACSENRQKGGASLSHSTSPIDGTANAAGNTRESRWSGGDHEREWRWPRQALSSASRR